MSVALARFSMGDPVVLALDVSNNDRLFLRGERLVVDSPPNGRTYALRDAGGHVIRGVTEHDVVGPSEPLPAGLARVWRSFRSFLAGNFGGTEG